MQGGKIHFIEHESCRLYFMNYIASAYVCEVQYLYLYFWLKDPEAKKPEDWEDNEKIDDPEDTKPEDWDKPEHIPDPEAKKPDDWDDEMDGEWEPPMIDNPDYKVWQGIMYNFSLSIICLAGLVLKLLFFMFILENCSHGSRNLCRMGLKLTTGH